MNILNRYLICIIKAALTDYKLKMPDGEFDWNALYLLTQEHKVTCLVGIGLSDIMDEIPQEIKEKFLKEINRNILLDSKQEYEAQRIFNMFENKALKYMPMKGYNIKKLYPESYMRYMCDIDILINNENYEQYEDAMIKLGYEKEKESNHEHIFIKKPMVNVELHKSIVPSYNTDLYDYYGNGWKYADKIGEGARYEYSPENQYIFMIVHLAKHYQASGIGLSHFIDIYVINKECNYDKKYVEEELKKIGLEKFHSNVLKLIDFWFAGKEPDETVLNMNEFVFSSGAYGNFMNHAATEAMIGIEKYGSERSAKRAKKIEVIFPPVKRLAEAFPILEKYPFLYPVFLIYRNVRAVLFRRRKIKNYMEGINYKDDAHIKTLSFHLQEVGLKNNEKRSGDL